MSDVIDLFLNHNDGVYKAGEVIFGSINFNRDEPMNIIELSVKFKGFCKVWFAKSERNPRTIHESFEEYFNKKTYIISGKHLLPAGRHKFEFNCPIPSDVPSSFEGIHGYVRYDLRIALVASGMLTPSIEKTANIKIWKPIDLNNSPYARRPIEYEIVNMHCCMCTRRGTSEVQMKLPVGGFCPGQTIPIEVNVTNPSRTQIEEIKFSIKKDVRYVASTNPTARAVHSTIAEIKKGPIRARTTRHWDLTMTVPAMELHNLEGCRFIHIDYDFKISVNVGGCHETNEQYRPIVFGHIPLAGFQDEEQPPLGPRPHRALSPADFYYHPPATITSQPLGRSSVKVMAKYVLPDDFNLAGTSLSVSPPPPSYEDAMASTTNESKKPSTEETSETITPAPPSNNVMPKPKPEETDL
ncbi:arrestin domain-containing protein 1-like [Anticarsia gemmatalis]|uniref:arrestin domain-containing protein 1-like n=1 Tax=Anticarsia gemmatalis TaxID=129554 RepID=UPI003F76711E